MSALTDRAYFTREEAADRMRVSVDTIKRAIHAGNLIAKRTGPNAGGKYLISAAALDTWFETLEDA